MLAEPALKTPVNHPEAQEPTAAVKVTACLERDGFGEDDSVVVVLVC